MGVVALRQVKGDDPVLIAGNDLSLTTGEQVERKTTEAVTHLDREPQFVEPVNQPALSGLGYPVLREPDGIPISRASPGQGAAEAQARCGSRIDNPVAPAAVEIGADWAIGLDGHHGALLARVPDRAAARHTD